MHRDFAFIQTAPNRVFVGWGPFDQLPMRRPDWPAFFITDFFLADPHPWRHPAQWEEMSFQELAERFPSASAPRIEWQPLDLNDFAPLFDSAKEAMRRGEFQKIQCRSCSRAGGWPTGVTHGRTFSVAWPNFRRRSGRTATRIRVTG